MANQWLRLWHDMPNDPKFRTIARAAKQPLVSVIAVYIHLLVIGSEAEERGSVAECVAEDVASACDLDTEHVQAIITAMEGRVIENGILKGWEKRQPEREDGSAERARAWREKKKEETNATRTQANASERERTKPNAPDKDTDTDTDTEEEKGIANAMHTPRAEKKHGRASQNKFIPPDDWRPSERAYALLEESAVPRVFAERLVGEFVLYWQERGERRAGWDATFINRARDEWERAKTRTPREQNTGRGGQYLSRSELNQQQTRKNLNEWLESMRGDENARIN